MKIAVIVPVYNAEKFLPDFLSCLEKQTRKDFEFFFIDDCSVDNSASILQDAVNHNELFHYLKNAMHSGAAISRNIGIENSQSDYVLCLDADDLVSDDLIEQLINAADTYYADMVMLERGDITRDGSVIRRNIFLNDDMELYIDGNKTYEQRIFQVKDQPKDFLIRCLNGTCDRLIKRELLEKYHIRFQNLPSSNDVFYTLFSTFAANRIVHTITSDFLYYRRIHSEIGRISNNRDPMCAFQALRAVREKLIRYQLWKRYCEYFWIFALDSLEKQLFVCKYEEKQRQVYQYLQQEGLRILGIPHDPLYDKFLQLYKEQYTRFLTQPYEEKCFLNSMSFQALCESNKEKIRMIFDYAEQKGLQTAYWGAGRMTAGFLLTVENIGKKIDYLIDNSEKKQGKIIFDMEIMSYDMVSEKVGLIVISNKQYYFEILKQIKEINNDIKVLSIQEYLYSNSELEGCLR